MALTYDGTTVTSREGVKGADKVFLTEKYLDVDYPRPGQTYRRDVGLNVDELLKLSTAALQKSSKPSIRLFNSGGFNKLFLLTFDDEFEAVARFPFPKGYSKEQMLSEISTMLFARQYLKTPIPQIYAWSVDYSSPVSAPFILMERLRGKPILPGEWYRLKDATKFKILDAVADVHAKIVRPLPPTINRVGSLFLKGMPETCSKWNNSDDIAIESFEVGPKVPDQARSGSTFNQGVSAPLTSFDSIAEYWTALSECNFVAVKERCSKLTKEQPYIVEEERLKYPITEPPTVQDFTDAHRDLMAILGSFARTFPRTRPDQQLCLWTHDFALRNMLFDAETYELTGVIDWENSSIVPLALSARPPRELEDTNFLGPDTDKCEGWSYYPADHSISWTIEESEDDPSQPIGDTWCRFYYSGKLALRDERFRAKIWHDRRMPLILKELMEGGWAEWLGRKKWLAETAARLSEGGWEIDAPCPSVDSMHTYENGDIRPEGKE